MKPSSRLNLSLRVSGLVCGLLSLSAPASASYLTAVPVNSAPAKQSAPLEAPASKTPAKAVAPASKPVEKEASSKATPSQLVDFRLRFTQALDKALANETKTAVVILNKLLEEKALPEDERDRVYLSIGRIDYQDGFDEAALEAYKKVRLGSASWLEALEERSWVEIRSGHPEVAIGTLKTVLSPVFKDTVDSEPYFTMSLAQLRVCDYKSLFKTIDKFKKTFHDRVHQWEAASDLSSKYKLHETSETIQKVNLVEAEAIQHLYLDDSGKRQGGSVAGIPRTRDEMSFPEVEGDELWADEADHVHVRVKGCPTSEAFKVVSPHAETAGQIAKQDAKQEKAR